MEKKREMKCPQCGAWIKLHEIEYVSTHPEGRMFSTFGPQPEVRYWAVWKCTRCDWENREPLTSEEAMEYMTPY